MQNQRIAIIGAGTAGLAAAALFKQRGHDVTVFEKFQTPKPLGAGLLLQPTGLAVLAKLGLDRQVIAAGHVIHRLYGKACGSRFTTMKVQYRDYAAHLFGVGTHRGTLFSALYDKVQQSGVPIHCGVEAATVEQQENAAQLYTESGELLGTYDLVVDASGQRSQLRRRYADVKLDKHYPYAAVWSVVALPEGGFRTDTMEQRYKRAYHMIGVLPVGTPNGVPSAAFFWSLRAKDYDAWRAQDFAQWKTYVAGLWPETAPLLQQFTSHDDLTFATYRDVILRRYHRGRLVFIGDAAHCTSPQLGQGANLALVDALVLAESVEAADSIDDALARYTKSRKKHLRFYQMASRMLTPFFQSDSRIFCRLRLLLCGLGGELPFTRKITAHVLTGTKTGFFTTLDPGQWADDYRLVP